MLTMIMKWLPWWLIVLGMTVGAVTQQVNWLLLFTMIAVPLILFQTLPKHKDDQSQH